MTEFTVVAHGLRFPKSPVLLPDGSVTRICPGGAVETVAEPGGGTPRTPTPAS